MVVAAGEETQVASEAAEVSKEVDMGLEEVSEVMGKEGGVAAVARAVGAVSVVDWVARATAAAATAGARREEDNSGGMETVVDCKEA